MKILALAILQKNSKPCKILASEYELGEFSYFKRSGIQEFLGFFVVTLTEKTSAGVRQSVEEEGNVGHVYVTSEGLTGVIVTDKEYPTRVAFSLLNKVLDEFSGKFGGNTCNPVTFPALAEYLAKYQNPKEADSIMKVQKELDETKIILHKTIESVLDRGEKLENLVAQSEQLSTQSKAFYKTAKKTNSSCCSLQ